MGIFSAVLILLGAFVCAEGLLLQGGQLKADQDSEARWDEASKKWYIRLTCGAFTFLGSPPLNVTWTTPKGQSRFSSGYDNGRFYLHLDTPIEGGNYTCAIPVHYLPLICNEGEGLPDQSNSSAVVMVDELRSRLTMAEAKQRILGDFLQDLTIQTAQEMKNLTQLYEDVKVHVEEQQVELEKIEKALNKNPPEELPGPCASGQYEVLDDMWRSVLNKLVENDQNHCDNHLKPGWYRFYLNGSNALIPHYCVKDHHCQTHAPQWVEFPENSPPAAGQEVEARACANWNGDCCNWVSPITVRNCGEFFIYRLTPLDTCHLAYCATEQ